MAIARDGGAAYPLVAGSVTNTATLQVNGVVTSAADTYIVVKVAWGQGAATVTQPVAVTWVGGAPAGCSNFECWAKAAYTVASPDATGVSIWLAKATQAIASSKSVLVTAAASALVAASMSVDAITGSSGPGEAVSNASNNGSSISRFTTVKDVTEGSWLFTAGAGDNPGGVTPQTNTTEEDERIETTNNAIAAVGTNSSGTKRDVDVGWTGSQAWFAVGTLEMRASGLASVGPFSSGRQRGEVWSGGFWAKSLIGSRGCCGVSMGPLRSVAASYVFPATGGGDATVAWPSQGMSAGLGTWTASGGGTVSWPSQSVTAGLGAWSASGGGTATWASQAISTDLGTWAATGGGTVSWATQAATFGLGTWVADGGGGTPGDATWPSVSIAAGVGSWTASGGGTVTWSTQAISAGLGTWAGSGGGTAAWGTQAMSAAVASWPATGGGTATWPTDAASFGLGTWNAYVAPPVAWPTQAITTGLGVWAADGGNGPVTPPFQRWRDSLVPWWRKQQILRMRRRR